MTKLIWKIWLFLNKLTENPNDYVATVDTAGTTRKQEDIIKRMIDDGTEIQPEIIKAVLDRTNRVKEEFLLAGYAVSDGLTHYAPRITGTWEGTESFTQGKHKATVDLSLSKTFHEKLKHIGVEVLGVKDPGARIMLVTDVATGKTSGPVTPGDDLVIVGDKIKVIGLPQADGSLEEGIGVFFVTDEDIVPAARISENSGSRIVARIPASLATASGFRLRIVTRFSNGSSTLLKTPRTIEYDTPFFPN
jgi:hypothetical protein